MCKYLFPNNAGVVYIKYSKTSEAAKALEEMHGQVLGEGRPIKVLVASRYVVELQRE